MSQQPPSSVQIGDVIAGKYCVERVLGVGGMGIVVAARHTDLHELRAIKLMLGDLAGNPDAIERFLREARAAARLKSEHVAKVHDVGRLETGAPYMVMEYLDGADLHAILKAHGPMPLGDAVTRILEACEGIAEAHAAGIVHRDLKPANLFVTRSADGTPSTKVLDFGISKLTQAPGSAPGLDMTKTTAILGSPLYMSPEHMQSTRDVDARTDIWALGIILYQLTTGVVPFRGESITQLCAMVLQQVPIPPSLQRPGLPIEFDRVVLRCLEKHAAHRYANVAELAVDLLPFGNEGARTSVERIGRMLGVPTSRPSVATPFSINPMRVVEAPDSATISLAGAQGGPSGTGASWGQTAPGERSKSGQAAILIAALIVIVLVGAVGIGIVVTHRAATTVASSAAPVTDSASAATASASAPSIGSTVPTIATAEPAASSDAPVASAKPDMPSKKEGAKSLPAATKIDKTAPASQSPQKRPPAGAGQDVFGDGRK